MAAHDLINAAVKANESAMRTAIKNGYPVQLPANQYLPKAMNGNIDVIHLGQFADLDAGFDEYRKQQAAQQAQAASQDFSDLDAGFAEWSAAQGGQTSVDAPTSVTGAVGTGSTSVGGQSTGSRSGRAFTGRGTAQEEIPSLDNMAVPVTAKTTTKAEKTAAKEVKQANSLKNKADKTVKAAEYKAKQAEKNLMKKSAKAEAEAQKADAMRGAAKVTKKGNTTVIEPAQNVQQAKRKMQNLAKEEARAQAEYTKAQEDVRKAEMTARKAADRQQAASDRAQAVSAFAARRTANSGTVSSAEQATNNAVRRDIIDQAVNNQINSYDAMPKASAVRGASGRVHSGSGRGFVPDESPVVQELIPTLDASVQNLVPTLDVNERIQQRQAEAREATSGRPVASTNTTTPEMDLMQSAVRADALRPQQSTSRLAVLSDPNRRLTKEEQAEAEQIIRDYNREHGIHGGIEGWYDGPNDPQSPEYQEYAAVQRLKAKTTGGAIGSGISDAYNLFNGLLPEGAAKLAGFVTGDPNNSFSQSIRQANDLRDQTMQASQTQAPLAYAGGNMAGKMSQYMATNGLFDSIATGALGLEAGSEAAFWANQLAQNAQDWAISEIPDYIQNRQNGMSREEALRNFGREALIDAGGNVTMGALGDYVIPSLINRFGRNAVESVADAERAVSNTPAPIDDSLDSALFGTGMMQDLSGADIPALKEADDYILGGVGRQADDVADAAKAAEPIAPVTDAVEEAVDEIPSVQSIAEDTGIPEQADEVLNVGADEIPSATRQAAEATPATAPESIPELVDDSEVEPPENWQALFDEPATARGSEEATESAFKLSKESADELQSEVKSLKRSFNSKIRAVDDQQNEYALAFKSAFDKFSKDPTPETYAEARAALNEYVDHSSTVKRQAWNGEWYDRTFDNSSMSESFVRRFDGLAEKYGFKTSDAAEEIPILGKTADEVASTTAHANQADVAGKVADATRATNADAVPGSGARTAEAVNGPDEPNIPLGEKERGFAKSSRKKGLIDDEIKAKITNSPLTYKQLANKTTAERARQLFADTETFDDGERILKGLIDDNDAAATMYAKDLVNAYAESGQTEAAMKVMDQISTALTKRGQFTQAAVLALAKDDPMTALQYVQKELKNLNADGLKRYGKKWKDFSLTEEEIKLFENIKPGDEEAIKAAYDQIGKRIGREFPSTLPEKWMEARRIAMLLNVRTNIRNIGANIPTAGMRTMADRVEAVGQHIYKLWNPDFEITQSVTGNLPGSKYRRLAADIFNNDDRMQLFRDAQRSKYNSDLAGGIMDNRQVFHANALEKFIDQSLGGAIQKFNAKAFGKEGVQSGAETLRNLTYKLLDIGDSPFVRENFVDRLASYMKAQGIEDAAQVPDEAIAIAWEEAMKATYKDDSWMNAVVGGAKKSIAKIPFGIGKPLSEGLIPFVQAPANIGARMVDYSMLGGGKGVADLIKGAKAGDDVLVRKGIEEMSKGLTGTGLAYLGYKLHQSGLLTGSYSDNKRKREAQQEHGFKEWALHIGDRYYTYDWAQPFAQSLIAGTIIADAIEKSDEANYALLDEFGIDDPKVREAYAHIAEVGGVSKDIGKALVNSWFNASPLNALSGFMGSSSYGWKADIGSGFEDTARNFVTSFIPSLSGAIARGTDTTVRATKDGRSDAVTLTNQIKAKIPGLSKTLPAAYDAWGREKTRGDSVQEAMISQNLIPGETGIERLEPYEEEAARLADAMEDDALYPFVADYVVGDKKLSTKEREEYQHVMGDRSREIVEALMATEAYQTMDDSQKAEAFKAIYSASKSMAENQLFSKDIAKANQKLAQAYADGGAEGAANFLTMKTAVNDAGLRITENNQKIYDKYGQEGIQQLIELTDQFDAVKQARKDSGLDNNINIMTTLEMLNGSGGNAQLILDGLAKSNQLDPEKFEQRSDGSWVYNQKEGTTLELTDAVGVEPVAEAEPSQAKAVSQAQRQQRAELRATQQPEAEEIPVLEEQPKPVQQTANVEINPATGRPVAPTRQTAQADTELDPITGRPKLKKQTQEIPKLEPNGNATWNNSWEIENSKSYGRFRQVDPSYTVNDYARVYNAMDKDKNGKLKSAEIQSYLDAMSGVDEAYRWAMFNAFANQGWGNPYKK